MAYFSLLIAVLIGLLLPVHSHTSTLITLISSAVLLCVFFPIRIIRQHSLLFFLACVVSALHVQTIIDRQWPSDLEGQNIIATLRIENVLKVNKESTSFAAELLSVQSDKSDFVEKALTTFVGRNVRLSWRSLHERPELGETWQLQIRLRRPRGFANPGGFDYQAWLLHSGYIATGYVRNAALNQRIDTPELTAMDKVRVYLERRLFEYPDMPYLAVLRALLLGESSSVSDEQWQVLNQTGTIHLMAISGLHIGLVAWGAFILVRRVLCICPSFFVLRVLPPFVSILSSGIYAALSGWSLPTQRAWLMVLLVNLFLCWGRRIHPMKLLLLAALVSLLNDPFASTQNGFYLSFAAVFFLVYSFYGRTVSDGYIKSMFSAQWVVFWGVGVVLMILMLPVSLLGPIANIIAIPVVSFLVIPFLFLSALLAPISESLSYFSLYLSHQTLAALWQGLQFLSSLDGLFYASVSPAAGGFAVLAALFVLAPVALALRMLGAVMMLLFLISAHSPKALDESFSMTALDVGQGLSIVIENGDHVLVYDVGARFASGFDLGTRVVVPYLRYRGIREVDQLMISHGDNDHIGGLNGVLESIDVQQLLMNSHSDKFTEDVSTGPCLRGQSWTQGDMKLRVLWPTKDNLALKSNNRSCVILIEVFGRTILLAGDIEKTVEDILLEEGILPETVDVLIAPHHGSRTSSSPSFVTRLSPKHVIFSAGYKNAYRHPSPIVVDRYHQEYSQMWNTGEQGAVTVNITSGEETEVFSERLRNPKPWY